MEGDLFYREYLLNAITRKRHRSILRALRDEYKRGPCSDCGIAYPKYIMSLDHIIPEQKTADIGEMISQAVPIKVFQEELNKCERVCMNCHALREHNRLVFSKRSSLC